jgi:hypothetical protein
MCGKERCGADEAFFDVETGAVSGTWHLTRGPIALRRRRVVLLTRGATKPIVFEARDLGSSRGFSKEVGERADQ